MLTSEVTEEAGKNRPLDYPLEIAAVQVKFIRIMTATRFLQRRQAQVCPDQATPQSQTHSWFLL